MVTIERMYVTFSEKPVSSQQEELRFCDRHYLEVFVVAIFFSYRGQLWIRSNWMKLCFGCRKWLEQRLGDRRSQALLCYVFWASYCKYIFSSPPRLRDHHGGEAGCMSEAEDGSEAGEHVFGM